jgi:hypothetical protein
MYIILRVFLILKICKKNIILMEDIVETNDQFDFSKLLLTHPVSIPGGAYFTKILNNNKSLYVQTIKSVTRQGIIKTGKKYHCELMFDSQCADTIHWFERLEETCQKLLFEKNDQWFQNSLEENDVQTAFIPVIRIFKSGKFYLVRCNIKLTTDDQPMVKIYNENKQAMLSTDITNETNIMALLEIQGIKFTTRSFQLEIEMKQIMVLNDDTFFENCLINPSFERTGLNKIIENKKTDFEENKSFKEFNKDVEKIKEIEKNINKDKEIEKKVVEKEELTSVLDVDDLADIDELKEVDTLNIDEEHVEESVILKQPKEVYLELYKKAREKAKAMKREMILSFLEAKHIKESYMIDVYDENEYNIDIEIDAVSENELENL